MSSRPDRAASRSPSGVLAACGAMRRNRRRRRATTVSPSSSAFASAPTGTASSAACALTQGPRTPGRPPGAPRPASFSASRYSRGPPNPGPHVGSLWSASGSLLARATFTGETATGWQQASFSQPVAVTANTTYVASYHAPSGGYALDLLYFNTAAFTNGPL